MMRTRMFLVAALLLMGGSARAQGAAPAQCTVVEVQASDGGGGVDGKLSDIKHKLSGLKWTEFKQLARSSVEAAQKKPASVGLTSGGKAILIYKEKSGDAKRPRLRLGVQIEDKSGTQILSTTTTSDSGDWFLLTGEPYEKGVYILAIGCTAK